MTVGYQGTCGYLWLVCIFVMCSTGRATLPIMIVFPFFTTVRSHNANALAVDPFWMKERVNATFFDI